MTTPAKPRGGQRSADTTKALTALALLQRGMIVDYKWLAEVAACSTQGARAAIASALRFGGLAMAPQGYAYVADPVAMLRKVRL